MAAAAVPSELRAGEGMILVMLGKGSVVFEVPAWRLRRRESGAVVGMKDMKKGVYSPSKGAAFPSVVLPRKTWSSWEGGAGFGVYSESMKASLMRRTPLRIAAPADTALPDRFILLEVVPVPLLNLISTRKFG